MYLTVSANKNDRKYKMISVVIPLYNKEESIYRTLTSVLEQTYSDYEILIIDDGSTDRSVEEVSRFCRDHRELESPILKEKAPVRTMTGSVIQLRLIHQTNGGVSAARNRGIEEALAEFIAFLDADDQWTPTYLQTQFELTRKYPQCNVFATSYEFEDHAGKRTPILLRKMPFEGADGILSNYFEVASCSHPPICSITVMVRKTSLQEIGGFPIGIKSGEDLLTWARLAVKNQIAYSTQVCAIYSFDMCSFNENIREPEERDIVGEELLFLIKKSPSVNIKSYYSRWKKIRASIYFRYRNRQLDAWRELSEALRVDFRNTDLWKMLILFCIPYIVRKKLLAR